MPDDALDQLNSVTLRREGGFAGMTRTATVTVAALSPAQREHLIALLRSADVLHQPAHRPTSSDARDTMQYTIDVMVGTTQHTVWTDERAAPEEVKVLIDYLLELAAQQAPGRGSEGG